MWKKTSNLIDYNLEEVESKRAYMKAERVIYLFLVGNNKEVSELEYWTMAELVQNWEEIKGLYLS